MSADLLKALGLGPTNSGTFLGNGEWSSTSGAGVLESVNPTTGEVIATVEATSDADYETIVARAQAAFKVWRTRMHWVRWSPWKWARASPRVMAKCRK